MPRTMLLWMGIALVWGSYFQAASQESSSPAPPAASPHRALLNRYCVTCHNEKLRTAELTLDKMDVENVSAGAPVWEKVVRKLRAGQMPPSGMPRPDQPTLDSFATYLETALDRAAAAQPNPGRSAAHRLNRAEYTNAIRDLLALEIDGESLLPAEDAADFDNIADVMAVSPLLAEKFLSVARKISRLAIGNPAIPSDVATYVVSGLLTQNDRMSEDLPFGSRGGIAFRHRFPLDGEYVIKVRLRRKANGTQVKGIAEPHLLDVRLDGARIKLFTFGGQHVGMSEATSSRYDIPPDFLQAEYERTADNGLEVRIPVKAGTRLVQVAFPSETIVPEGFRSRPERSLAETLLANDIDRAWEHPAVSNVSISGPFNTKGSGETPSRRNIFVCRPTGSEEEGLCAKKILSTLARRAYRRPVTDEDIQPLLSLYEVGRSKGGFEAGIELALRGILVSTEFLFRIERDPANVAPNTAYPISDLELASRLSFFLWSSIPDDELLDLAENGKLKDSAVLEQQVRRMLADFRSKALVENFAGQWLYLRNVPMVNPNRDLFPQFDENLQRAFRRETELFFGSMLREDRSVLGLLSADYTFLNERLARHYGVPDVYGNRFRRVTLSDEGRRGLLGQGSILSVTSYPNRTSTVLRGKWVLDNLLGTPPPEPPTDIEIPALQEKDQEGKAFTMRQAMEQHASNPACAGCHRLMDPIGFALENFDAIGQWRTTDGGNNTPIDPSGMLPDGAQFQGPAELQKILLRHPERFVHTVTEKLLTYALGRGVEYTDAPAIRRILREAAPSDYRWSSIIAGIINSTPFQMRRSQEP